MKKKLENNIGFIFFLATYIWGIMCFNQGLVQAIKNKTIDISNISDGTEWFEEEFNSVCSQKNRLINLNGLIRRILGQREMNGIVRLNNGWITNVTNQYDTTYIDANVDGVTKLQTWCDNNGRLFLYVQPPFNVSKTDNELPAGVYDCHNQALDYLIEHLKENGVNVIDLREEMESDKISFYNFVYTTDHHWNMEGGFYAYTKIAHWIQEQTGTYLDESLLDMENYNVDTYENVFLGSAGKRVGVYFGGVDDYHLIYPKAPVQIMNLSDGSVASFQDMVINFKELQVPDLFDRYPYDYSYAKYSFNQLKSLEAKTDLRVLLLTDSYQHGINPYMMLTYRTYNIDQYMEIHTNMIESYNPDIVVMLRYAGNIMNEDRVVKFFKD